jgi:hypothetical protein
MSSSDFPAAAPSRTSDTVRPARSGTRRAAARAPTIPPLRVLSVVERHEQEAFPCQSQACSDVAAVTARVPAYGMSVVVLLCDACAKKLPAGVKPVAITKGGR